MIKVILNQDASKRLKLCLPIPAVWALNALHGRDICGN